MYTYLVIEHERKKEMEVTINKEDFIDSEEVANLLGIALSTLQVKVRAKEIPLPIKLKTYTFWKRSEIEDYIAKNKEK